MFEEQGSLALGYLLDSGREKEVDTTRIVGLLGFAGEHQRCRVESTTCEVEAVQTPEWTALDKRECSVDNDKFFCINTDGPRGYLYGRKYGCPSNYLEWTAGHVISNVISKYAQPP